MGTSTVLRAMQTPIHLRRPLRRYAIAAMLVAMFVAVALAGRNWISLAANAITYQTVAAGEAANLATHAGLIYATRAEAGLDILDSSGITITTMAPAAGSESVDDIAIAGTLLFALDARVPGHITVFSLDDPRQPRLVMTPREVPVGPFSGVSAAEGLAVVSGGTSQLTVWRYDSAGALTGAVATADLGRGQPDVLLAREGGLGFVSTHYWGVSFGLDVVRLSPAGTSVSLAGQLRIANAGFTRGGAKPANFPIETAQLSPDTVLLAYARGLAVIGASSDIPVLMARLDLGGPAVNVDARDGRAAVVVGGSAPQLVIISFAGGVARIVKRFKLDAGVRPVAVVLTPSKAAVAARDRGVLVFDL